MHALVALAMLAISAAPPRVQLAYQAPADAGCPDETWFRQAVAARVGRDPFDPNAELQISARIRSAPPWMEGTVELRRGEQRPGLRHFRSRDCRELATDMVVAVSIAIDPQSFSQPPPAPPPPVAATPPPPPPSAAPPPQQVVIVEKPPPAPPAAPLHLRLGLGALASGGISPYPTAGAELRAELRGETFGLRLELEADLPRSVDVPPGQVASQALRATLAPCLHRGGFGVCAELSGALLLVTGEVVEPSQRKSAGIAMLGASVEYAFALGAGLHLAPFLRLQAVVPRTTILSGQQPVWVTAPIAGALGVLLDAQIL